MHRVYEIFEVLPNGSRQRVTIVSGLEPAKLRLRELALQTPNECFAADSKTRQIVIQMNLPTIKRQRLKRILIISYDEQLGLRRAEILRSRGYQVVSIIGNETAKVLLTPDERYELFIVGHAAPLQTREEMVIWLKAKYPKIKILGLNPPDQQVPGADYNARQDDPEQWLSIVTQQMANSGGTPPPGNASAGA